MNKAILLSLLAVLVGCASTGKSSGANTNKLEVNVQAFVDPGLSIPPGSSFATVPIEKAQNRLLEKELLALVRARLEAKGLRYDETKPDFLVAVSGYLGGYGEPFPRFTDYFPSAAAPAIQSPDITGSAEAAPPVAETQPSAPPSPATSPAPGREDVRNRRRGYRATQYTPLYIRIIDVFVGKRVGGEGRAAAESVWAGRAQSTGATEDLALVAPPLLDELFTEFPKRTGQDPHRVVNWSAPASQNAKPVSP
ncbi:MAG TPA: DUF4136 domain-containing protein [Thermoanaerobaculia bacterium]|jgi:hypothetical protein|nr:DUF4136 domain-containing protein [Thermoanaerobaculia bacterium]